MGVSMPETKSLEEPLVAGVLQARLLRSESEYDRTVSEFIMQRRQERTKEKELLANYVVDKYIPDFSSIAIDAGSTLQQIVEKMMDRRNYLSILTNNMTAFRENSKQRTDVSQNEFILTGGKYVPLFDALMGNETLTSFDLFHPHVAIIGVSGITADRGIFCHGNDEVRIKDMLFKKKVPIVVIPVDYSKLGRTDSYLFGKIEEFKSRSSNKYVVVTVPPMAPEKEEPGGSQNYVDAKTQYESEKKNLIDAGITLEEVPIPSKASKSRRSKK